MQRFFKNAYVAAPIFTKDQLQVVSAITMTLKLWEYKIFSPYEASRKIWNGRAPKDCSPEERRQVLVGNINNLDWAELLVAWVGGTEDGRTDTGVVWEMGHFDALKLYGGTDPTRHKFVLAYIHPTDVRKSMNLMLAGTVNAIAYGPAQLDKAVHWLAEDNEKQVCQEFGPDHQVMHEEAPIK